MPRRTRYEVAREAGREALRSAVLQAAAELVALEGPSALTMRRLADHIGASTTVLYNLFDGKNGIIDAMVRSGHVVLRERLAAIPGDDGPAERLAASARVYREVALEDPARYQLMFGNALPGYQPSESARTAARSSFDALKALVQDGIEAGILKRGTDPDFAAELLTSAAHGAVSLELSGHFDDATRAEERFAALTSAALQPLLAPPRKKKR
ncbi:MAG TPA: TetR/AcrR family transcriptional regulator [Thermoleophilaceae bacterium]